MSMIVYYVRWKRGYEEHVFPLSFTIYGYLMSPHSAAICHHCTYQIEAYIQRMLLEIKSL